MPTSPRIVLVHSRNSLNLGAAARAMANFGLDDLVVVAPYEEAWRVARSARAGAGVLQAAREVATVAEAVADCRWVIGTTAGTDRTPALPLEDWEGVAASLPATGVAILFGSEKFGLGIDDLSYCNRLARIPTRPDAPSMNLGQAVALCAYELARPAFAWVAPDGRLEAGLRLPAAGARSARGASKLPRLARHPPATAPPPAPPSTGGEVERVLATWYPLLERLGVVQPEHRASQTRALRQMLLRWHLEPGDARRLLGVARQLQHQIEGQRD